MIEEWTKKLGRAEFYNVPNKYKYISHQYIGAFIEQLANSKHVTIQRNRPGCPLVVKNGTEEYDIPVEIFWSCIHMDIRNKFRDPTDTIHNLQSFLDILGTEVTIQE